MHTFLPDCGQENFSDILQNEIGCAHFLSSGPLDAFAILLTERKCTRLGSASRWWHDRRDAIALLPTRPAEQRAKNVCKSGPSLLLDKDQTRRRTLTRTPPTLTHSGCEDVAMLRFLFYNPLPLSSASKGVSRLARPFTTHCPPTPISPQSEMRVRKKILFCTASLTYAGPIRFR